MQLTKGMFIFEISQHSLSSIDFTVYKVDFIDMTEFGKYIKEKTKGQKT